MLSDSAVHVAFTESIVPGSRERVVKCRERTLRKIAQIMPTEEKLIGVEVVGGTKFDVGSSRKGWRRDGNHTIICSVFSVFVCGFGIVRTLSPIVDFWALIDQKP